MVRVKYYININGGVQQTSPTFPSLCDNSAAPDTIIAIDANGCSDTLEVIVSEPSSTVLTTSSILNIAHKIMASTLTSVTSGGTGTAPTSTPGIPYQLKNSNTANANIELEYTMLLYQMLITVLLLKV